MTPYRLINTTELRTLQEQMTHALQTWNQEYSRYPLSLKLCTPSGNHSANSTVTTDAPFVIITPNHQQFINYTLFGQDHECFNTTGEALLRQLFAQLLHTDSVTIETNRSAAAHWNYAGSTCLQLELYCHEQYLHAWIHPDWVYHRLSQLQATTPITHHIKELINNHGITLDIELDPMMLPLQQLMHLHVGDVLISDHKHSAEIRVIHQNEPIAKAQLGQSQKLKSIQFKEFL